MLATTGCASNKFIGRPGVELVQQADLPPPTQRDSNALLREYLIGPFDKLQIAVFGIEEMSHEYQVDAAGKIIFPLVGVVQASGKSPSQLSQELMAGLRSRYVRRPDVTVNPVAFAQMVVIDGAVVQPGQYPVMGRLTLMRSIALARGITQYANSNYVVVCREVDGKKMAALYDLRAIRQGLYADPEIYANDLVLVNESRGKRIFEMVIQGSGLIITPLVALLQ